MLYNEPPRSRQNDSFNYPIQLSSFNDLRDKVLSLEPQNHSESQLEALLKRVMAVANAKRGPLRIGMYDGSFDPPHYGHVETARAAVLFGRLDLLVMNCHAMPNAIKPDLSPFGLRTKMLSSYFIGDPLMIVSPRSRCDIERILSPHRIVGVIGSDTFQRFLQEGIAQDFKTDEIIVSERHAVPLISAPATLELRPVCYIGRSKLAYNNECSTAIRAALARPHEGCLDEMLNRETQQLVRAHYLSTGSTQGNSSVESRPSVRREIPRYTVPEVYTGCTVELQPGLENGLLSDSFVFRVREQSGEIVAFMKMLPPERNSRTHLSDEANGLALFNKLGLQRASAPEAILSSDPPSLWIARAPGETPAALITHYERGLVSAQEVYEALHAVGACLRELHTRHSQPFDDNGAELLESYIVHHQAFIDQASPLDLQSQIVQGALETFRREATYLREKGLRCSLIHGDANTGNFLWDRSAKVLSVIDMQRLGTQVRTGAAAFSSYEYQTFLGNLNYFPNIGFEGVRGRLTGARAAFQAGYGAVDKHEARFFRVLRFIREELGGPERVHDIARRFSPPE